MLLDVKIEKCECDAFRSQGEFFFKHEMMEAFSFFQLAFDCHPFQLNTHFERHERHTCKLENERPLYEKERTSRWVNGRCLKPVFLGNDLLVGKRDARYQQLQQQAQQKTNERIQVEKHHFESTSFL